MRSRSATVVSVLALSLLGACSGRGRPPHIVIVLVDTLRADRLGCYGNGQSLTPFIDSLARRGVLFRHAYATSSWTVPSVASLFTSRHPQQHRMVSLDVRLGEAETTLAERLAASGYWTAAYVGHFRLPRNIGLWQGFGKLVMNTTVETSGRKLTENALTDVEAECSGAHGTQVPCFLYLHYFEPHGPYEPPEDIARRFVTQAESEVARRAQQKFVKQQYGSLSGEEVGLLAALYDGEVVTVDAELRRLFEQLEQRGLLDHTIVVLTADHGEEFRDHGGMSHGTALYNETVRVPLLIVAPGFAAGQVVEENVSLVDVVPTLLDLGHFAAAAGLEGRSLVPLMTRERSAHERWIDGLLGGSPAGEDSMPRGRSDHDVILQLEKSSEHLDLRRHAQGIVRGSRKLLVRPAGESDVFDLADDPDERKPNPPGSDSSRDDLSTALTAAEADLKRRGVTQPERVEIDEGAKEQLRALGYQNFF